MRLYPESRGECDDLTKAVNRGRFSRRPLLRAAVLGQRDAAREHDAAYESLLRPRPFALRAVVTGTVSEVSPHALILRHRDGEERLALTPATAAWRGAPVAPTRLCPGDHVIVRKTAHPALLPGRLTGEGPGAVRRAVAERIWADIGRATGTILAATPSGTGSPRSLELLVDEGPAKAPRVVVIAREAYRQILVRFPRLEPGYLIDVIGQRRPGFLRALTPATSQPAYRADQPPPPPLASGHVPSLVSGTAVWHEPGAEPESLLGLAYPMLDPETCCEHARSRAPRTPAVSGATSCHPARGPAVSKAATHWAESRAADPHDIGLGCVRLPYLSVGSVITMRNDCTGLSAVLPVTSCGAIDRLFCDRCVECSTPRRGRIADLTMAAFVELGGRLENGCFNASLIIPG